MWRALFEQVLQGKKVEDYRNTFANLALPLFAMSEPIGPKQVLIMPAVPIAEHRPQTVRETVV